MAGAGLPTAQARVVEQEIIRMGGCNPMLGMGTRMLGPTLLEHGNEEQKKLHLTRISRGEKRWCQGYSEPGSGSDLASLQTKAEDKGDHYLVNGQKIWTSGSLWADWCFCLVRTDPKVKQDGISFLLIDMKTPGIEVRPIKIISGDSPFSEVFFTDVKVPKENLVGKLNKGWTIAKRLLQFERDATNNNRRASGGDFRPIDQIAREYIGVDEQGRIADADLRARITKHMMEFRTLQLMQRRMLDMTRAGEGPSEYTSVAKNARARITQEREELLVEIMGQQGLGWSGDQFKDFRARHDPRLPRQQGDDDLQRHDRSAEQRHRQADHRPARPPVKGALLTGALESPDKRPGFSVDTATRRPARSSRRPSPEMSRPRTAPRPARRLR